MVEHTAENRGVAGSSPALAILTLAQNALGVGPLVDGIGVDHGLSHRPPGRVGRGDPERCRAGPLILQLDRARGAYIGVDGR